jgi:hypothetical protein
MYIKWHWDNFSLSTSVFPCQYHSTIDPYSSSSTCCCYQNSKWSKPGNLPNSNSLLFQKSENTGYRSKGKGKVFPLQASVDRLGSGRLRLRIFSTFGTMKVVRSSPLRTGRLYPQKFSWYSFLEAESTSGHMVPSVASDKIPSDNTGNRSRDPPTRSAVP